MIEATIAALYSGSPSPKRRRGSCDLRNHRSPRNEVPARTAIQAGPLTVSGRSNRKPMERPPGELASANPYEPEHVRPTHGAQARQIYPGSESVGSQSHDARPCRQCFVEVARDPASRNVENIDAHAPC